MGVLYDYIFDNSYQKDAKEEESNCRTKYPKLLHHKETIQLAFKDRGGKRRDKEYFTTHRILIKDGKGVGSKRKNYKSIPYDTILAFSVQSAGAILDGDVECTVFSTGIPQTVLRFGKSNCDIFQMYQLLNLKVDFGNDRGTADVVDCTPPNLHNTAASSSGAGKATAKAGNVSGFVWFDRFLCVCAIDTSDVRVMAV